jgi:hypothetical protein
MIYTSMLLQLIETMVEDANVFFFFLIFNHEQQFILCFELLWLVFLSS